MTLRLLFLPLCLFTLLFTGCLNLSPDYAPPDLSGGMPAAYREDTGSGNGSAAQAAKRTAPGAANPEDKGWREARPADLGARSPWWIVFSDPLLDDLMQKLGAANQNLAATAATLRVSLAQIGIARSAFFPGLGAPFSTERAGAQNKSANSSYSGGLQSSWEISFWNALPALEAAQAEAAAAAADFAALRLLLQAELAQNYFLLRSLDSRQELYESTIIAYRRAAQLTNSQFRGGMATRVDYDQAAAQLAGAEAQLAALKRQRAELEHGIALLCGQAASGFNLPRASLAGHIPRVPPGLPAALLERRPDVAAAERRVASANEEIGLARAAWFPSLTLGGDFLWKAAGWQSAALYSWSLGPGGILNIFEGGRILAQSEAARAGYDREIANYRQSVLSALKEVEDNLSALRYLEQEAAARGRAAVAARSALRIALSQYEGGLTTYLQVVSSQTTALSNESSVIEVQGLRLATVVNLIKALGGGFSREEIAPLIGRAGGEE
ncbi:MAG: efflux transporter outer membrane subunit [Desulfovibrio sp.]|nr:efflux transporter outer membrane subunit [Desulfovibrio sp.]